jgi:uncharacterized protein (TIGR02646 family)
MIKLHRPEEPKKLKANKERLKSLYSADKNSRVWSGKKYIKEPLYAMTSGKCAYCEKKSENLEIEHYYCKKEHSDKVVEWDNLLLACRACNGTGGKGEVDCDKEPIINPAEDDPQEHLIFSNLLFIDRNHSVKARNTIKLLNLNRTGPRKEEYSRIAADFYKQLDQFLIDVNDIQSKGEVEKSDFSRNFIALLQLAQRERQYSAVCATIMLQHPYYEELISKLNEIDLWTDEMAALNNNIEAIALI